MADGRWSHRILIVFATAALMLVGCASKERQLSAVARDWCMTIRASQVIPVYPMTEDLQPGDVFLVQQTVNDQHKAYSQRGFLPLENHLTRVNPTGYPSSYSQSFYQESDGSPVMPRFWLKPGEQAAFAPAPGAAFPAYTFAVSSGQGFSAALPIQGVPVGLSLLNSNSATGSVTIKEAHTYGVAIFELLPDIREWSERPETRALLSLYAADDHRQGIPNYIRVVHRVYLTGKLNVTLNDTSASSGGASIGVPKPVELPLLAPPTGSAQVATTNAESYKSGLSSLNNALAAAAVQDAAGNVLPGATLKVVASSARSVSIDEDFVRPVVIGYLGFDMAILSGGLLGPPCPTYAVLERGQQPVADRAIPELTVALVNRNLSTYRAISSIAASQADPDSSLARIIKDGIDRLAGGALPAKYPVNIWKRGSDGTLSTAFTRGESISVDAGAYRSLNSYLAALQSSIATLQEAGAGRPLVDVQAEDLQLSRTEVSRIDAALVQLNDELRRANQLLEK